LTKLRRTSQNYLTYLATYIVGPTGLLIWQSTTTGKQGRKYESGSTTRNVYECSTKSVRKVRYRSVLYRYDLYMIEKLSRVSPSELDPGQKTRTSATLLLYTVTTYL